MTLTGPWSHNFAIEPFLRVITNNRNFQTIALAEVKKARDNSKYYLFDIREPNELIGGKIHAVNWAHIQPRNGLRVIPDQDNYSSVSDQLFKILKKSIGRINGHGFGGL